MFLSKHPNGTYYIYFDAQNGKRTRLSTKTKYKSEALKVLSKFQQEYSAELLKKTISITLTEFRVKFLAYSESIHSEKHNQSIKSTFNNFINFNSNISLDQVTIDDFINYVEFRLSKVSAYSVRRDIANLSSAFNWAITKGYMNSN